MEDYKPQNNITEQTPTPPTVMVETLADDMAEVIGEDKEGMVRKIIHGEEEREALKRNLSPDSRKNKIFMTMGGALMVLGVCTLAFFWVHKPVNTLKIEEPPAPLIFTDKSETFEIAGQKAESIKLILGTEIANAKVQDGDVEGIYFTVNGLLMGLRNFNALIKDNFVLPENTLFVDDHFLMGVIKPRTAPGDIPASNSFFMLIKMRTLEDIFGSLRNWEGKMLSDLQPILGTPIDATNSYLLTKNFEDGIIENKNARILRDNDGNIVLMYVFANDNSVIITTSEASAHEIVLRLSGGTTKQ